MRFNQATRRWEKHPDCTCDRDPCVCRWLRPLDMNGQPMPYPIVDALREKFGILVSAGEKKG